MSPTNTLTVLAYGLISLLTLYTVHSLVCLLSNVRKARATGLPYLVLPISEFNVINIFFFSTTTIPYLVSTYFPAWLADILYSNVISYRWTMRDRLVKKYGGVYLAVTPGNLTCNISDAEVVAHIYRSRKQFFKPAWQYYILELYGTNILTVDNPWCPDSGWAHHRHHTVPAFNEKNNSLVWEETLKQASGMLDHWKAQPQGVVASSDFKIPGTRKDLLKLALQVISSAGFGVSLPFKPSITTETETSYSKSDIKSIYKDGPVPPPGFSSTFRSVSAYMHEHLNAIIFSTQLLPSWVPRWTVPFSKNDFAAFDDMGKYLRTLSLISKADLDVASDDKSSNNLARLMAKSNVPKEKTTGSKFPQLTDEELLGNLHIFTVAGHETTATTARFALVLLALHPEKQNWLRRGIKDALQGQSNDPQEWDYAEVFPKMVTPLCVMLESLRLCPPVVTIPKWTDSSSAQLEHDGESYTLPPKTDINLNATGLHYSTEYWGPDASSFDPSRWDASNKQSYLARNEGVSGLNGPGLEHATLHRPIRGAYIPFSDGIRACVGKKFAQVEFVALLAVLLKDYEVCVEDEEGAKSNAWKAIEGSVTVLTLGMVEDVPLVFRRKDLMT